MLHLLQSSVALPLTGLNIRHGYEVPKMILLQVYLYTYNLLMRVTFEMLPLSSNALSPTMLPLFETFLQFLV
jgi:hypothetical protein